MATAYVVTSGCYSDYFIEGVFTKKDQAKAFIIERAEEFGDAWYGSDFRIEEYEIGKGYRVSDKDIYLVEYNGKKWNVESSDKYVHINPENAVRSERLFHQRVDDAKWSYRRYIITNRGEGVALKIAQDEFYQIKAERIEYGMV